MQINDDRDLYCFQCGYNLRGLMTDPRRCPECGHESPVADLLVPAEAIAGALSQLESAPAMATGAVVVALAWLTPVAAALAVRGGSSRLVWAAVIAAMLACVFAYVVGVRRFRDTCDGQAGWMSALFRHHVHGLLAGVFVTAIVGASALLLAFIVSSINSSVRAISIRSALISVVVIVAAWAGTWFFARLAKRAIVPLQRARAAEMAREYASHCDTSSTALP